MLESNKKRSERKKREAASLRQIVEDRFVPHSVPFEDEYIAPNIILTPIGIITEKPIRHEGILPDTTIGIIIAIVLIILFII